MSASLNTLPPELLYRIIDYLDSQTILLSFRYVCRKFRSIADQSHQFELNFRLVSSKHDFHRLCRLFDPTCILSLTLIDNEETPNAIILFFSMFSMKQLVQLRSLTLINVYWEDLETILNEYSTGSITSLTLHMEGKRSRRILEPLSCLIFHSRLQTFSFNTFPHSINEIFVSIQSELRYLSIGVCTFQEYQTILQYCPQLRTLMIDDCWITDETTVDSKPLHKLSSLTLKDTNRSIHQLHQLLVFTPSLTSLRVINSSTTSYSLIHGIKWETFIQHRLLHLLHFEFLFYQQSLQTCYSTADIEPLITPFRRVFWTDEKRWFVHCDYIKRLHRTRVHTIPFPQSFFEYYFDQENISLSSSKDVNIQSNTMDRIQCLLIDFMHIKTSEFYPRILKNHNLTELHLRFDALWSSKSSDYLSRWINFSFIRRLFLLLYYNDLSSIQTKRNLSSLFTCACHMKTLILLPLELDGQYDVPVDTIASLVPSCVKHFTFKVQCLRHIEVALTMLRDLCSITFHVPHHRKINSQEVIQWLTDHERTVTYSETDQFIRFWLR